MRGFLLLCAFLAISAVPFAAHHANAADPEAFQIGKIRVWAIADNTGDRDMSVFLTDEETIKKYAPGGKSPSGVLCFLLETDNGLTLIDTGNGNAADHANPSLLMSGLEAIKIAPEKIDSIIITHMHGDHIGGLSQDGKAAFPNATIKIGRLEHDFWLSDESLKRFPDRQANFDKAKRMMELYKGKVEIFDFGGEVIPGVTAVDARGHTPGHTALLIESGDAKLLCVGDLVHSAALQFARPDVNARYDMYPTQAHYTRRDIMQKAAWNKLPIAGMHLPFPGVGRVERDGDNFAYKPGLQ